MSIFRRLYRGETRVDFVGHRRRWYIASGIILVVCAFSFVFRGFNWGIEFVGGTQFQIPVTNTTITTGDVTNAFHDAGAPSSEPPQEVGSGSTRQIVIRTGTIDPEKQKALKEKAAADLGIKADNITSTTVSSSWGHDVTMKALQGLVVFLIAVGLYIAIRFQWRMAFGALAGLGHDLILSAGIYSLVGFEVTPSTIVGLLTILGFSLYDTVVVYDKVAENSKDLTAGSRMTYEDAANLAVNQTLMRSINTSLIALLPVAGLLFVGVGLLGVGTIEDLALILFVGIATGAYSSLFLCTPIAVELVERQPEYKALRRRVIAKRSAEARKQAEERELTAAALASGTVPPALRKERSGAPAPPPRPGARPQRPKRK